MKFRNISGGPLTLPTLGIGHVPDKGEFEAVNEDAKWLEANAGHLVERTDKTGDADKGKTDAGSGSEDGKK